MSIFLINPPRRKARGTTRKARKATPAQLRARAAFAAKYGNAGTGESVKARRTSTTPKRRRSVEGTMAVRKRSSKRRRSVRRAHVRHNPPKRRRKVRAYHHVKSHRRGPAKVSAYWQNPKRRRRRVHRGFRRNPGGGLVGQLIGTAKDVATIVVGKAATNYISRMVPFGGTSKAMTAGKKLAIAIGLSMIAKRVTSQRTADLILAGGVLGPIEDFAATLPVIGTALAADSTVATKASMAAYLAPVLPSGLPSSGADRFSAIGRGGMGSYVQPSYAAGGGM